MSHRYYPTFVYHYDRVFHLFYNFSHNTHFSLSLFSKCLVLQFVIMIRFIHCVNTDWSDFKFPFEEVNFLKIEINIGRKIRKKFFVSVKLYYTLIHIYSILFPINETYHFPKLKNYILRWHLISWNKLSNYRTMRYECLRVIPVYRIHTHIASSNQLYNCTI